MVIRHYTSQKFLEYLNKNSVFQSKDPQRFLDQDKVVYENQNTGFKMPIHVNKKEYYASYVTMVCREFQIPVPECFEKINKQMEVLRKMKPKKFD